MSEINSVGTPLPGCPGRPNSAARRSTGLPRAFGPRNDRGNFNLVLLLGPGGVDSTVGTPVPGCPGRTAKRRTGSKIPRHCEAEGRGNLLERRTNLTALPGDCHVGLCPPRNDNVILTWSFCFAQKKNPRFRGTGGFGVLRHKSFQKCSRSRAVYAGFTPHQRTNCLSALPTYLWTRPEPSPPASFSTSATETWL